MGNILKPLYMAKFSSYGNLWIPSSYIHSYLFTGNIKRKKTDTRPMIIVVILYFILSLVS